MKYLGESFAIHGGGGDLVFPHHEAEIAQSECLTGKPFVPLLDAHRMLYCGEHKMSNRSQHGLPRDLLPVCPPDAIRLYLLGHHSVSPGTTTDESLLPHALSRESCRRPSMVAVRRKPEDIDAAARASSRCWQTPRHARPSRSCAS